ncbi:hypothetical protein HMPREF0620_1260 [Parascardovia denticolens DSM 10105 = JCM 12538]|uniref:ATP-binding protein n=1 Tax=Parascardovia denticolens DSM 10105 = JCM 12538 TaxID=864564 RepID=E6K2M1_PARDN|nr:DUF3107 domain-containing protein [Parascardovia denticolens]EFG32430.1 hypothetical protein HMPREF9017_01332 [Parascardovia denticolens F0305]EFT82575.1 hypothetical protein HMPREF0620_1260 [Parascardovia denticolens DSM 10105 = JCM 12538]BAR04926.1 conserved hypothetical protein [Parascardovia denticolens DSM 10105 = JCM 12538]
MDVEIGIMNVARPVTFTTDASAEEVAGAISEAASEDRLAELQDNKGRKILIPTKAIGYAVIGSETSHPVGFGALG